MTDRTRRWAVLLSGLAIVAVLLLAVGLTDLELLPGGIPPRVRESEEFEASSPPMLRDQLISVIFVVLGILTVLLVAFFAFYLIFLADTKKRLLIALGLLVWFLILYFISQATSRPLEQAQTTPVSPPAATPAPVAPLPPGVEMASVDLAVHPPGWLVWLGAIALALLAVGVLAGIAWLFWFRSREATIPLEELGREAERALGALEAGADLEDTIMRCYFQMSQILKQQQGIIRPEAMTPREFERGLRGAGLPPEPVAQLTRLFEKVRYGARTPDEGEERRAITCLEAVVNACRSIP